MGTRHLQTVINKEGEVKLQQYGQWDGYPEGQGIDILKFLRNSNLEKYQSQVDKLKQITDEQKNEINKDENWNKNYPYLSRDCGANIHKMIEDGDVKFVNFMPVDEANKWCEGFFTIDFSKNIFVTEYYGKKASFKLDKLPTDKQYLSKFKNV